MKKTIKEPRNNVAKQLLGWVAALSLMAGLVAQASADELVRINFRDADIYAV